MNQRYTLKDNAYIKVPLKGKSTLEQSGHNQVYLIIFVLINKPSGQDMKCYWIIEVKVPHTMQQSVRNSF
jgi:hypothetical protein